MAKKTTSDLPTKVKVGWRTYAIEEWDQRGSVSADRYGECSHTETIIRVSLGYGMRQGASTLLHEIMHAIHAVWQINDQDNEERTIKAMEAGLATVWIDNPEVMAWIGRNLVNGT